MSASFLDFLSDDEAAVLPRGGAVPIQKPEGTQKPPPPDPPRAGAGATRRFVNEACNSRLAIPLPRGRWEVSWRAVLPAGFAPDLVLQAGARVAVQGKYRWHLLDLTGRALGSAPVEGGDLLLAPELGVALSRQNGALAARGLVDGERAFMLHLTFGATFRRTFLASWGGRLLAVGVAKMSNADYAVPVRSAVAELIDVPAEREVEEGTLMNTSALTILRRETAILLAAMQGGTIALATEGCVMLADADLKLDTELTGDFVPLAMSLDAAGLIHLIVDVGGHPAYWRVTAKGERLAKVPLPLPPAAGYTPPIVTHDHRVFIPTRDRILALDSRGDPTLSYLASGYAGAAVTGDDQLLVADGAKVLVIAPDGAVRVELEVPGALRTAPVLDEMGRLLVATADELFCFTKSQR